MCELTIRMSEIDQIFFEHRSTLFHVKNVSLYRKKKNGKRNGISLDSDFPLLANLKELPCVVST